MKPCELQVLTDHYAVDTDVPHFGGAMPPGFQPVIDLFAFIGAFNGSTAFINDCPLFRIARSLSE